MGLLTRDPAPWNHNIHYHPVILRAVPAGARRALDVGCGEGILARELRRRVPQVCGIDIHAPSIAAARAHEPGDGIEYLLADLRRHPFRPASFDFVASVAALHHVDAAAGLRWMAELLRPGGVLAIVGLAQGRPSSAVISGLSLLVDGYHRLTKTYWEHGAPTVWPPPETNFSMWRIARKTLPGSRFRRHLLWRYSLIWTKGPHPLAPLPTLPHTAWERE